METSFVFSSKNPYSGKEWFAERADFFIKLSESNAKLGKVRLFAEGVQQSLAEQGKSIPELDSFIQEVLEIIVGKETDFP
jgi:hypothetical protein